METRETRETRERRTLMMELRGSYYLTEGVRKPTHWFSIQTMEVASGLLECMRDEMVSDPRSDSWFFIKSTIFNWGIVLFLRVYKTLTLRHHIVTATPNQQVASPPTSSNTRNDLWHQDQQYYSNGRFFLSSVHCSSMRMNFEGSFLIWTPRQAFAFYTWFST